MAYPVKLIDSTKFVASCIIATLLFTMVGGEIGVFLEDFRDLFQTNLIVQYQVQLLGVPFVFHSVFLNQTMKMQKFSKARCNVGSSADKEQELNT